MSTPILMGGAPSLKEFGAQLLVRLIKRHP